MSIRKIAQITGLSTATVSHALNGTRPVSEKSRGLVERAAEQIGYRPNRAARMLKTRRSNTAALVIPGVRPGRSTNLFFMNVLSGARDTLEAAGYDLIISTYREEVDGDERVEAAVLEKNWVDGLLIVPGRRTSRVGEIAASADIPLVLIDRTVDGAQCPCVHSDNLAATRGAIRLFYESGKRRIGFLGGMSGYSTGDDRLEGYRAELAALGLPWDPGIVGCDVEYTVEAAYRACGALCERGVDAVFTSNNILTMGVLKYLRERGIDIPGQVGVIAYEDYEWMEIFSPPITTVRQQTYAMGAVGAELLLALLQGREHNPRQVLEAPLIRRSSHGIFHR